MTVYFENSYGYIKPIKKEVTTTTQAMEAIMQFLNEHHYHSYYQRSWYNEDRKMIQVDVGSHSEFFYIGEGD